jgi:AraC family transcriptional regulator
VIDIALRYGYSSNESFTRAFKKVHGVNPSDVRRGKVNVYTHFPVINYDIPEQNLISLRYDLVYDFDYSLSGKTIHIIEEDYDETQRSQEEFLNKFLLSYPSSKRYYRVHLNLSEDNLEYDYFVGYERGGNSDLESLRLSVPKAVRFCSNHLNPKMIPRLKRIIYSEWEKCKFLSTHQCEVEYCIERDDGTVDFHYIVAIR